MFGDIEILQELQWTIILIIGLLIVWIFLRRMGKKHKRTFRSTSVSHLRQRFINGEISEEEYWRRKDELEKKKEQTKLNQ